MASTNVISRWKFCPVVFVRSVAEAISYRVNKSVEDKSIRFLYADILIKILGETEKYSHSFPRVEVVKRERRGILFVYTS